MNQTSKNAITNPKKGGGNQGQKLAKTGCMKHELSELRRIKEMNNLEQRKKKYTCKICFACFFGRQS